MRRDFWEFVDRTGPECWPWLGGHDKDGYGVYGRWIDGRTHLARAHRVAYELAVGPIPPGLVIDHLCRNPICVNPAHLEPVTSAENTIRGIEIREIIQGRLWQAPAPLKPKTIGRGRPKKVVGRPSKYRPEFARELKRAIGRGESFIGFCRRIGINKTTGYDWLRQYIGFANAFAHGRAAVTQRHKEIPENFA